MHELIGIGFVGLGFQQGLLFGVVLSDSNTETLSDSPVILLFHVMSVVSLGHEWDQLSVTNVSDPF